jgi:P-type conjugative transfer protein TrbJ
MGTNPVWAQVSAPGPIARADRRGTLFRRGAVRGAAAVALLLAAVTGSARPAAAQMVAPPTSGPSYIFGIGDIVLDPANLAKSIEHYVKRVQQMDMQRRQLQAQIDALRKLPSPNWRNLGQLAQQLDQVVQQANGIAYTLVDAGRVFGEMFPGYAASAQRLTTAHARLQTQRTLATLRGILGAASHHGRDMQGAMVTLNALKARMGTTQGPQQAAELATTVAGFQADQLAMVRQTMVMQATAAAVVEAERIQQKASSDLVLEQAVRRMTAYRPLESGGFDGTKPKKKSVPR